MHNSNISVLQSTYANSVAGNSQATTVWYVTSAWNTKACGTSAACAVHSSVAMGSAESTRLHGIQHWNRDSADTVAPHSRVTPRCRATFDSVVAGNPYHHQLWWIWRRGNRLWHLLRQNHPPLTIWPCWFLPSFLTLVHPLTWHARISGNTCSDVIGDSLQDTPHCCIFCGNHLSWHHREFLLAMTVCKLLLIFS